MFDLSAADRNYQNLFGWSRGGNPENLLFDTIVVGVETIYVVGTGRTAEMKSGFCRLDDVDVYSLGGESGYRLEMWPCIGSDTSAVEGCEGSFHNEIFFRRES